MAAVPSLGEISAASSANPALSGIAPVSVIDPSPILKTIQEGTNAKMEADWNKLNLFLKNKADFFSNVQNVMSLETADQDKDNLKGQAAEIFQEIAKDPRAFFGGGKMDLINSKLGKLQADAITSKQNKAEDWAWRRYVAEHPEFDTEENKSIINNYWNKPLGQRRSYILNLPQAFDAGGIAKGLLDSQLVTRPFSETRMTGQDLKTPGRDFIVEEKGKTIDSEAFQRLALLGLDAPDSKGRPLRETASGYYKRLPENVRKYYDDKGGMQSWYSDLMKAYLPSNLRSVSDTKTTANPFAIEQKKADDKLKQMGVKFGYDKILELMRLGGQKDLALFKENLKDLKQGQQQQVLNDLVDRQIQDAHSKDPVWNSGLDKNVEVPLQVSPETLKIFGIKQQVTGGKEVNEYPVQLLVNSDGTKVTAVFKDRGGKIDENKTKSFSIDEYKYRLGKDVLGVAGLNKQFAKPAEVHSQTKTTYNYKGKNYSREQLENAAKQSGLTLEQYINKLGIQQ